MRARAKIVARGASLSALAGALMLLTACGPSPPPPRQHVDEIVAAVRPGPASWFPGADGEPSGFDHDLLIRFAREQSRPLKIITVRSASELLAKVVTGEADIGMGGLFQAAPAKEDLAPTKQDAAQSSDVALRVLWTTGIHAVEPVLIYNIDGYKPKSFADLVEATVAYPAGTGLDSQLAAVRYAHPETIWKSIDVPASEALIARVSEGSVDYAIVPSNDAAVARNIYLDFNVAFAAGPRRELAWAVAPKQKMLRDALDQYLARLRKDGTLARYADRFFDTSRGVERIDAGVFRDRIKSALPRLRSTFEDAQAASGTEWRLLAAVAYQESQWDPLATSETGARGLMQLTEETARHLGVGDRLDTKASILAAGRYLQMLKTKLPTRITEPDRTWLALAAFNIGIAHLEDARILAQKQKLNPDHWNDVKKTLPLLAQPEFYEYAKFGYARGGMPVAFVDRVRAYYDILLRTEPLFQPRLRRASGAFENVVR
ncbi:MAG TPA: membrane-bound lytic murein transglycosylase MltF [Casimicrobiaceae bacterium]